MTSMTVNDREARDLLAAARRGLSPTAADGERVRRLMAGALVANSSAPREITAQATPVAPPRVSPWLGRVLTLGVVAAAAGGVGYRAGQRAEKRAEELRQTSQHVPTVVTPVAPSIPVPTPAPSMPQAPSRPPKEIVRRPPVHAPAPAAPSSEALAEEVRALRGAERALRENHPGLALALLRELERAVPNGRLTEERQAVRTIARCTSGDVPFGVNLAQDFAEHYPGSVYDRRVTDACTATDSSSPGDLPSRRNR